MKTQRIKLSQIFQTSAVRSDRARPRRKAPTPKRLLAVGAMAFLWSAVSATAGDITTNAGGTVTGSASHASYGVDKLFDGDTAASGRWLPEQSALPNVYAQYDLGSVAKVVTEYSMTAGTYTSWQARAPKAWTLQGSNDGGSTWTTVDTQTNQTGWTQNGTLTFTVSSPGAYKVYKVVISQANGADTYLSLAEMVLYGYLPGPSIPDIIVTTPTATAPIPVTVTFKTAPQPGPPGLTGGTLTGNMSFNANPGNLGVDPLGPSASELTASPWAGNTTIIYTGLIYDADGVISFNENIDDVSWLSVNGQVILNDSGWNNNTSGSINTGSGGWFPFEWRGSNGGGGAGRVGALGFGWDPAGGTNFTHPQNSDSSTADLFTTSMTIDNVPVTGFTAGDLTVTNATVSNFAGSGHTYTFDLTPAADPSNITVSIAAGAATDGIDNSVAASKAIEYKWLVTRSSDLVGHWTFDDDTSNDVSGNGYHGVHSAASIYNADSPFADGKSINLNSDQYVTVSDGGSESAFDGGTVFSISSWVKGWPNGSWEPYISKRGEGNGWQLRRRGGSADQLSLTLRGPGNDDWNIVKNINDGGWHHITGVFGGGKRRIYVDGVKEGEENRSGTVSATGSQLVFGARDNSNNSGNAPSIGNHSSIWLDDVRFYRAALIDADVAAIYNNGAGDLTRPRAKPVFTNVASTAASPIAVSVTFVMGDANTTVSGFTSADVSVTGGSVSNFSGSGHTYTFDVSPTTFPSAVTVSIAEGAATGAGLDTKAGSTTINYALNTIGTSILGMEMWMDGNDLDADGFGDGLAPGAAVNSWTDKSGNGYDFTGKRGDPSYSTQNGRGVVYFDGNDGLWSVKDMHPNVPNFSMFSVARWTTTSNNKCKRVISDKENWNWIHAFHDRQYQRGAHYNG